MLRILLNNIPIDISSILDVYEPPNLRYACIEDNKYYKTSRKELAEKQMYYLPKVIIQYDNFWKGRYIELKNQFSANISEIKTIEFNSNWPRDLRLYHERLFADYSIMIIMDKSEKLDLVIEYANNGEVSSYKLNNMVSLGRSIENTKEISIFDKEVDNYKIQAVFCKEGFYNNRYDSVVFLIDSKR